VTYNIHVKRIMAALTLGLDFDPEAAWNERKQIYERSQLIVK